MKTAALLSLLLMASLAFSLNVTGTVKGKEILFTIDGPHYESVNLTLYLWKDGSQLSAVQKSNIQLPYYMYASYNSSGTYELRAVDESGAVARGSVIVSAQGQSNSTAAGQETQKEPDTTNYAIVVGLVAIIVLLYLLLRFLNTKSDNK